MTSVGYEVVTRFNKACASLIGSAVGLPSVVVPPVGGVDRSCCVGLPLFSSVLGDSVADPGVDGALNGADALFKGVDVLAGCDEALGDESVFGSG